MRLPHELRLGGYTCRVQWGDSGDAYWQKCRARGLGSAGVLGRFETVQLKKKLKNLRIILHPTLRENPELALEVFVHEALHMAKAVCDFKRVTYSNNQKNTVRRLKISHDDIYRFETVVAGLIEDNLEFVCTCRSCLKPKKRAPSFEGAGNRN